MEEENSQGLNVLGIPILIPPREPCFDLFYMVGYILCFLEQVDLSFSSSANDNAAYLRVVKI